MNRPARLPLDCPHCENRGVLTVDDDTTIACPLCNNWCMLCLEGVPTFVRVTRPYRGSLIAVLFGVIYSSFETEHGYQELLN